MKLVMDGQFNLFDLLDSSSSDLQLHEVAARKEPIIPTLHKPLTERGLYCIWCGREYAGGYGGFDYSSNHGSIGLDDDTGVRMCVSMSLTKAHTGYAIENLFRALGGAPPTICCWSKNDLHRKHVKKPSAEQWAEHARAYFQQACEVWGVRRLALRDWYRAELERHEVTQYGYPQFTVTTGPGKRDKEFCAYCGTGKNLNEGGGGPAGKHPDFSYRICEPCSEKYRYLRPPADLWIYKEIQ